MKKNQHTKDLIFLLATGLATVLVWAGFDVYRAYTKIQPPVDTEALLTPITPELKSSVLSTLEQRTP